MGIFMSGGSGSAKKKKEKAQSNSLQFFSEEKLAVFTREMRELSLLTELPVDSHLFKHSILARDFESALFQIWERGRTAQTELAENTSLPLSERRTLERRAKDGDEARSLLLRSNLKLVMRVARRQNPENLSVDDLFQEGYLGLEHALAKFEWRKGNKFSTYAFWSIRQAIARGVANTGRTIRLPVHAGDSLVRLKKARSSLELKLGRQPTLCELATEVEMPEKKVIEVLRFVARPLGIDGMVSTGEPRQSFEFTEDDESSIIHLTEILHEQRSAERPFEVASTSLLPEEIDRLLAPLNDREREILKLRFGLDRGEPRTLDEVGKHFNLTRERIRQIEAGAMSKLRMPSQTGIVVNILNNSESELQPDT
jgi:RNA polymerase sigma factor (sigma-70 family)